MSGGATCHKNGALTTISAGVRIRRDVKGEWVLYLSGAASLLFGILLLISPGTGAVALVWLIGSTRFLPGSSSLHLRSGFVRCVERRVSNG